MQIEHLNKETTDGTVRNLDALYQLFPSCFTEAQDVITGKMRRVVDWGKLRELLGEYVENGEPEWCVRRQVHDIYYCHLDSVPDSQGCRCISHL